MDPLENMHLAPLELQELREEILLSSLETLLEDFKNEKKFGEIKVLELLLRPGLSNREAVQAVGISQRTCPRMKKQALDSLRQLCHREKRISLLGDLCPGGELLWPFVA